ncbi:hypothetical protein DFJ43DRAFT_117174 [Lentinula guzmanii]|uniref:Uncharacterized protein n=1 Tax=Lentinula guzmanii TaxID=2804957 RepID=A0AA38JDC2_9AGAR|nr:hypothetical protein DFJ43DRAFT_117174 [Lentinula guzmanii]
MAFLASGFAGFFFSLHVRDDRRRKSGKLHQCQQRFSMLFRLFSYLYFAIQMKTPYSLAQANIASTKPRPSSQIHHLWRPLLLELFPRGHPGFPSTPMKPSITLVLLAGAPLMMASRTHTISTNLRHREPKETAVVTSIPRRLRNRSFWRLAHELHNISGFHVRFVHTTPSIFIFL